MFSRDQGGADNWGQVKKLTASASGAYFGGAVAVSGDVALVGDPRTDTTAPFFDTGAAYVYSKDQGGADNWGEVKVLTPSSVSQHDMYFGTTVAIDADSALVGAIGVASDAGAAYVFDRDQGGANNWGEVRMLTASDTEPDDEFGVAVSISNEPLYRGGPP